DDEAEGKSGRVFLHRDRGIAARQFQRTFVLADGMEVVGAELKEGLLSVNLERPETVRAPHRVQIATAKST
ncbi:MAG: Hsp20 family protein, partial [Xanthobacteraceae bacterium]